MATTWTIEIDWDRNNNFTGTYDDVTDRVIDARWSLGFKEPYQVAPHNSVLQLTLSNHDKRYSPEYGDSPLYGELASFRPVRIQSDDGVTVRTHWTGWIEDIQPTVNQYGERIVEIKAAGPGQFFRYTDTDIELQENKRTDEIIEALLQEVVIPPALTRAWLLGNADYGKLGSNTYLADVTIDYTLQQGKTTLAYAADNWVRQSDDGKRDTFNVYRAIEDTVAAEQGRFFFDRDGQAVFWNRHHLLVPPDDPVAFDDTMTDLDYSFAALDEFKNEVVVTCHPREISVSDDELLWRLDKPITLQPNQSREVGASYHDDSDKRIGGRNVRLENVTFSKGDASIVFEGKANRATLKITNTSKKKKAVLETTEVRGQKITDFGSMEATSRNNRSIAYYGLRKLSLNLSAVDDFEFAQSIADFEKGRRSEPSGKVRTITLKSHGTLGGGQHAYQLNLTIGSLIRVQESQTGHDQTYWIIGEVHKLSDSATLLETTWYLESATAGGWWILGTSELGKDTHLAY